MFIRLNMVIFSINRYFSVTCDLLDGLLSEPLLYKAVPCMVKQYFCPFRPEFFY